MKPAVSVHPAERWVLTEADETELLNAMRSVAGDRPGTPILSERDGQIRWVDVPQAVLKACVDNEMAIFGRNVTPGRHVYFVRTIGDVPMTVTIDRVEGDQVYTAVAVAGWFQDRDDLSDRLLTSFHTAMRDFGMKRSLAD